MEMFDILFVFPNWLRSLSLLLVLCVCMSLLILRNIFRIRGIILRFRLNINKIRVFLTSLKSGKFSLKYSKSCSSIKSYILKKVGWHWNWFIIWNALMISGFYSSVTTFLSASSFSNVSTSHDVPDNAINET